MLVGLVSAVVSEKKCPRKKKKNDVFKMAQKTTCSKAPARARWNQAQKEHYSSSCRSRQNQKQKTKKRMWTVPGEGGRALGRWQNWIELNKICSIHQEMSETGKGKTWRVVVKRKKMVPRPLWRIMARHLIAYTLSGTALTFFYV